MKQAKKIFTRMCLNDWGGIEHKILEFNEYVNLFSGKSGSLRVLPRRDECRKKPSRKMMEDDSHAKE